MTAAHRDAQTTADAESSSELLLPHLEAVLRDAGPLKSAHYRFGPTNVRVRTNSPELGTRLDAYFLEFLSDQEEHDAADFTITALTGEAPPLPLPFETVPPGPGKRPKEALAQFHDGRAILKTRTGLQFWIGGGAHLAMGRVVDNDNQVINFINNRIIERMLLAGGLLGHASAVAVQDRALAIAGFAGMGKSTLALHIMREGPDFLSNDRVVVQQAADGDWLLGIPKHPRVNPGTLLSVPGLRSFLPAEDLPALERLSPQELWELEQKSDLLIHEWLGPGRFKLKARLNGILILNWRHGAGAPVLREVPLNERAPLMEAFIKSPGVFFGETEDDPTWTADPEPYLERLKATPLYEMGGGIDFEQAKKIVLKLLGS